MGNLTQRTTLRAAEWRSHFGHIADRIADGVMIVGDDCLIKYANEAAERIFGVSRGGLIGKRCDDPSLGLTAADGAPSAQQQLDCCRESEESMSLPRIEQTVHRPDGTDVTVLTAVSPLHDEAHDFVGMTVAFTDITERKRAEEALRHSEERFRRLIETANEGVWVLDPDYRTTFVNHEVARLLGRPAEEIVGKPGIEFVYEEDKDTLREQLGRRRRGEAARYELRFVRADGLLVWARLSATPMRGRDGEFQGAFAMLTDITHDKETESAHRMHEEYDRSLLRLYGLLGSAASYAEILQALLSEIPQMLGYPSVWLSVFRPETEDLFLLDAHGRIETAIAKMMEMDPRLHEDIGGETFFRLPYKGDAFLEEVVEATHIVVIADARTDPRTNKELEAVLHNRTIVAVPLVLAEKKVGYVNMGTFGDEEGVRPPSDEQLEYLNALANHVAVAMDRVRFLKERAQAEEALRDSEERFRRLIETANEGVWAQDIDCRTTFVNDEVVRMLGYRAEEIVGRLVLDFVHDEDKAVVTEQLKRRREGRRGRYEMRLVRADGATLWVRLSATPMFDRSGQYNGSFAMLADISQDKERERARIETEESDRSLLRAYGQLGAASSYSEILRALISEIPTMLGYGTLWLAVLRPETEDLLLLDALGKYEAGLKQLMHLDDRLRADVGGEKFLRLPYEGDAFLEEIVAGTHIVVAEDARTDPRTNKQIVEALGNRTIVSVPLVLADRRLGVMGMGSFGDEGVHPPSARQLEYLGTLANHVAVAMDRVGFLKERMEAEEQLRRKDHAIRQAYTDVIAAVTGNKLILMTPEEMDEAMGEPLLPRRSIDSYEAIGRVRHEIRDEIDRRVPGQGDLDGFMVGVGEGLTNAIKHAGTGTYEVRSRDGSAQVVITDTGGGVDFRMLPRATLEAGYSTQGTLGMGFTIMLEVSDRVLLSTQPGLTILVLEMARQR